MKTPGILDVPLTATPGRVELCCWYTESIKDTPFMEIVSRSGEEELDRQGDIMTGTNNVKYPLSFGIIFLTYVVDEN